MDGIALEVMVGRMLGVTVGAVEGTGTKHVFDPALEVWP